MMWIRSPWWDGAWMLSGLPITLAVILIATLFDANFGLLAALVVVLSDTPHTVSPIFMAWMHRDYRRYMIRRPLRFVVLPIVLIAAGACVGLVSEAYWPGYYPPVFPITSHSISALDRPLAFWIVINFAWNGWHFAMQNYGILQIYRHRTGGVGASRRFDKAFCFIMQAMFMLTGMTYLFKGRVLYGLTETMWVGVVVIALVYLLYEASVSQSWRSPRIIFAASQAAGLMMWPATMLSFILVRVNHHLAAIGLSGHVTAGARKWPMIAPILCVAALGTAVLLGERLVGSSEHSLSIFAKVVSAPMIGAVVSFGFVHFLYDRWVWKLSDPKVRATIAPDLFSQSGQSMPFPSAYTPA